MEFCVGFCTQNYETGSSEVKEKLSQHPSVKIVEHDCQNYCGDCYLQPYALVNGEFVTAGTAKELLEKIDQLLASPAEA